MKKMTWCLSMVWGLTCTFFAEVQVADLFSDHMVLQQGKPIPIWGWGEAGEKVVVEFHQQTVEAKVKTDGTWRLDLKPESASFTARTLKVNHLVFEDVLVGEVWLASGQSNMEWKLGSCVKKIPLFQNFVDRASDHSIRYRAIKVKEQRERQIKIGDGQGWSMASPKTVVGYSAVAYLTALEIYQRIQVPMGIIEMAWGGHPIEPFIPESHFIGHPVLEKLKEMGRGDDLEGMKALEGGVFARNASWLPGTIFNARMAPIVPFAIRGAWWYQAESNSGVQEDPRHYEQKMKALMAGWRSEFESPDMPIYYVQLPQYFSANWVRMREEQRRVFNEAHTGMAVTIDLYPSDIHPPNKLDVAQRLARWPLSREYGEVLEVSGPMFKDMHIVGKEAHVSFDHIGKGLAAGIKVDLHETHFPRKGLALSGFELCDSEGRWWRAEAKIEGERVICWHSQIAKPQAVRYAWGSTMPADFKWNFYNKDGLPASPFVSDLKWVPFVLDGAP